MSLAGVDLNLLVAFDALLEEGSVTRAAKRIGLSQSAMSHALARLRKLLDDRLFVRTARGLVPTPRALELRGPIGSALAQIDGALRASATFEPALARQSVQLSAIDLVQTLVIPPLIERLSREAPGLDVVVRPYGEDVTRALAEGESDLAIGLFRRLPHVRQEPLLRDRFVCVVRKGHPCLRERLTATRFSALPHALVTPRGVPQGAVDRALKKKRLKRRIALTTPSLWAAALAVTETDMVLTAAERVVRAVAEVLPLAILEPPVRLEPLTVTMAWHERRERDTLHRWFRGQVLASTRS
ncbi:MAG TPA: LysR family transcriptional regulator [Polyangiaceae bacterium]|jgi:DNA-binding transcriptional LysR family regulator|nr:LysR family transcriptional regulator [Polyangiaceae bacterium]